MSTQAEFDGEKVELNKKKTKNNFIRYFHYPNKIKKVARKELIYERLSLKAASNITVANLSMSLSDAPNEARPISWEN